MKIRMIVLSLILIGTFLGVGCNRLEPQKETASKTTDVFAESEILKPLPMSERKKVLVLHSYHPEYTWIQDIDRGILRGLEEERFTTKRNLILEPFYMDTKRKTSAEWKDQIGLKAIEKIEAWKPDVVISSDDNAQSYVVGKMKDRQVPFVFLGVNSDPMKYGYIDNLDTPGHNVTGCIERERFEQSLLLLRKLVPDARRFAIICDDGPTGVPVIERTTAMAPALGLELVAVKQTGNFTEWQRFVTSVQKKADFLMVIVYHTLKDDAGNHVHEDKVLNWTITNSKLPDIGCWAWAVEGGLLCSEAISGFQQGYHAATLAAYILMGQSAGEFPVQMPRRGDTCVNRARAEMLGLTIPPDLRTTATIYNKIKSSEKL